MSHGERARSIARIASLLGAARRIADPDDALGRRARRLLGASTGLSPAGIELALRRSWEAGAADADVQRLVAATPAAPAAHVLLSANVFTAPLRAIAIGLAASERVFVRPSRREPVLAELLHEAVPGSFQLVTELAPAPGDHVWAYGSDRTLDELRARLPAGSVLHGHGTGFGVAVVRARRGVALDAAAARIAEDVVVFDQRGCLSPRLVFVDGHADDARALAQALARALATLAASVPPGAASPEEAADLTRYRDTALYTGELFDAGGGFVSLGGDEPLLPPVGRNLHVHAGPDLNRRLASMAPFVTSVGVEPPDARHELAAVLPRARVVPLGAMQSPPLDGPVDRRPDPAGVRIG